MADQEMDLVPFEDRMVSPRRLFSTKESTTGLASTAMTHSLRYATSKDDWDTQKSRIRKLYLEENKSLKDVMAEMEQVYRFKAT